MSYCRFSEADVYVYTSARGIECCGCWLVPRTWVDDPGRSLFGGYYQQDNPDDTTTYHSNEAMIAHLEQHRAAGHHVPDHVFDALRDPQDAAENEAIWQEARTNGR
jgi:hypothetical protein